jgi:hypothetical protein
VAIAGKKLSAGLATGRARVVRRRRRLAGGRRAALAFDGRADPDRARVQLGQAPRAARGRAPTRPGSEEITTTDTGCRVMRANLATTGKKPHFAHFGG